MYDFEAATGITQENVEQIVWDRERAKTIIDIVCAWCGAALGTKDGGETVGISHGICEPCSKKVFDGGPA